jgi:phage terminase large subunit GpA-like protein
VQNDRLEIEIVAWGQNKESWSVDYRIIYGSPSDQKTWNSLSCILQEEFESEDGDRRKINMLAIDAGFSTQEVYAWVRTQSPHNVMAIKGVDNSLVPINAPTKVDVNFRGKKMKGGVRLWKIGVSMIKSEIYNFLKQRKNEDSRIPTGYMHFPEYNTEYFKQLTAEQLVTKIVKGYPKREWQKTRDRNEALDCRVYARAAAIAMGVDRWSESKWEQLFAQKPEQSEITSAKMQTEIVRTAVATKKENSRRSGIIKSSWMR